MLDVTLAPGSAPPNSGTDDCKADLGGHGHGITTKALEHEIHIPGTPGVSSMADGQHPSGLFWYHPHPHGYSRGQVSGGTTGVITIGKLSDYACTEGGPDPATGKCPTGTSRTRVRLVELKDAQILADQGGPTPFQLRPDYDAAMCDRVPAAGGVNEGECQSSDTGLPEGSKWVFTVNGVEFPTISKPTADQDEVWRIANASPFGLGSAVLTRDLARGERIAAEELDAGMAFVNQNVRSDPRLPFGGVKDSGYGREVSDFGIHEFCNIKTVLVHAA